MKTKDWNDWYLFATVAQLGSFTRAAERLDVPKSSVSVAVARLEKRLGQRLLERSTRRLRLTEAGTQLLREIGPLFEQLEDVADGMTAQGDEPRGLLRIAAPYEFGMQQLGDVVCDLLARYPQLEVEVDVIARQVDPLAEGYDVTFAITAEALPDSGRIAKRVFTVERGLFASPALVRRLGLPAGVSGLSDWPLIAAMTESSWGFQTPGGERRIVNLNPRLRTPNAGLRLQAVIAGLGASMIANSFCEAEVRAGRLLRLLPEHTPDPLKIYGFMPARRLTPAKTRVFMDALEAWLGPR
ncbi:LysR family transcriptional regulator [Andreprevotia chitinilytica]|uniref:LysR family transcriptional regulator n=1 Tax=Andreprevotia chitinilytica TaxID=396808 RepID=UPI0005519BB3|nr:LysR family transcriptional regulator [Andreprevotia chitinilytica]